MSALEIILRRYAIEIVDNRKDFSELEGKGEMWKLSPVWSSWASRLDDGNIAFYLPETHEALTFLTGRRVDYIRARAVGSTTILFLVGYSVGEQTFGPFSSEEFVAKMDQIPSQMSRKLYFARKLQAVLNKCESDRSWRWIKSYREAMQYFSIHRGTVMAVGKLLGINMNDHDLTKTRLVQIALGLLWHWPGDRTADESQLTDVAMDAIRAGHLEVENHHPEFESANADRVDVHKLLTDRVCIHLQKDPKDTKKGWDVNLNFIPTIYREEWFRFAEQHKDICLYAALEQARAVAKIDFVNNRRMRSRTHRARTIHCCRWCQQRVWASSGLMGTLGIAPSLDIW